MKCPECGAAMPSGGMSEGGKAISKVVKKATGDNKMLKSLGPGKPMTGGRRMRGVT